MGRKPSVIAYPDWLIGVHRPPPHLKGRGRRMETTERKRIAAKHGEPLRSTVVPRLRGYNSGRTAALRVPSDSSRPFRADGNRQNAVMSKPLRSLGLALMWFILTLLTLWAVAALYVDFRVPALRIPITLAYVVAILTILLTVKPRLGAAICASPVSRSSSRGAHIKPSGNGDWLPDVDRTAWAEIDGDRVTIHNLRNCDYRTETEYSNCWTDRTVYLSQLRGIDFFLPTGAPLDWPPHPQLPVRRNKHVAFSIEARTKWGSLTPAVLGFFRQYELILHPGRRARRHPVSAPTIARMRTLPVPHQHAPGYSAGHLPNLYRLSE